MIDPLKQVTIERRLNISMKYRQSIDKVQESELKKEDLKTARLLSFENKIKSKEINKIEK
jgi:hypothetical protein